MESTRSRSAAARCDLYCPTAADLLRPYAKYPPAIQAAIFAVDTAPEFINLTRGQKAVLRAFLTRAGKDDGTAPILVNFEHAAAEAGISTKTIARAVALLIDAGWLVRAGEDRDQYGVFTYRKFAFTPAFCDLVRLPAGKARHHRTSMSRPVNKDRSSKEDQLEIRAKARGETLQIDLPEELQALPAELGIRDTGIAALRGQASRAGHKLADIVACARERLRALQLRGNRAFRYLERMCGRHSDYAVRAAELRHQAMADDQRSIAVQCSHKSFSYGDGIVVRIFDGIAEVMQRGQWVQNIAGRDMQQIYAAIKSGKLVEIPM